jgi:hypothetical protein
MAASLPLRQLPPLLLSSPTTTGSLINGTLPSCYYFTICYDWSSIISILSSSLSIISPSEQSNFSSSSLSHMNVSSHNNEMDVISLQHLLSFLHTSKHVCDNINNNAGKTLILTSLPSTTSIDSPISNNGNVRIHHDPTMNINKHPPSSKSKRKCRCNQLINNIGYIYLHGLFDTPPDAAKAVEWFKKSALLDDEFGCFNYGYMLRDGVMFHVTVSLVTPFYRIKFVLTHSDVIFCCSLYISISIYIPLYIDWYCTQQLYRNAMVATSCSLNC